LLRHAQGETDAAVSSIRRALDEPATFPSWRAPPDSDLYRLPLLAAQVEISLAAGDPATARRAADELKAVAARFDAMPIQATAAVADGAVLGAEGDPASSAGRLREGIKTWVEIDAPYEAARGRVALADAYIGTDEVDRAVRELEIARESFERLGATPDLRRAEARLAELRGAATGAAAGPTVARSGDRLVRTLMFTDIVDSTRLTELLGDDAWNALIRSHDDTLRSIVAEHGGVEIKTICDGLFAAFPDVDPALDAAIAIQRRLADQRRAQGFAPSVRIGLHRAEVTARGLDLVGGEVNQAARIGAAARGGEILASTSTLGAARRRSPHGEVRSVALKGLAEPVEVAAVDWI
jgi:class 3 adenylate cyclase